MTATPARPPDPAARRGRPRGRSVVVAAGLTLALASIGLAVALMGRPRSSAAPALTTSAQLAASAKAVAARHPELRAELEPMSAQELANAGPRGYAAAGVWILDPVGVATVDRPTVRWIRVAGAASYEVRIEAEGKILFAEATTADHVAFPARLEPLVVGTRHLVGVRVRGPDAPEGPAHGVAEFTVLPVPHRAAWRTLVGDVASNEPASIRDLLVAHWAIRRGLFGEALRRADAFSTAHPGDLAARPLLEALGRIFELGPAPAPWAGFARR